MRVIALHTGIDSRGFRRKPGQEFDMPDGAVASWFAPVGEEPKEGRKRKQKADGPATLSDVGRAAAVSFVEAMTDT